MAIILSNIGFIIYIFGFFFWIVSFGMKKTKKDKGTNCFYYFLHRFGYLLDNSTYC